MEIELKYAIKDDGTADLIWKDLELREMEEQDSRETEEFKGIYYDTADHVLFKNDIAFRVRKEGKKVVASLKWRGENQGALHTREELNINLGEQSTMEPNPEVFRESDMGGELMDLLAGKSLLPMIEVNVLRRSFRVDTGESLLEISIDKGEILTESGSRPLREVEIELFSGEQKELEALGEKLKERYSLEPEKDSKFAKGLMLLGMLKQ